MKKYRSLIILGVIVLLITGCKNVFTIENEKEDINLLSGKHYVEISIKNYGKIEAELDADIAPISVTNFIDLVNNKYYDDTKIHRVMKDFVIQGGIGEEEAKTIKGEFKANGKENSISHVRGTLSMARAGDAQSGFDTGSSQFFIVHKDSTFLDDYYAGFGKVTKGMEVVDKICNKVTNVDEDSGAVLDENDMPVVEYIKVIEK